MSYRLDPRMAGAGFNIDSRKSAADLGARKLVYLDSSGKWNLADEGSLTSLPVIGITMHAMTSGTKGAGSRLGNSRRHRLGVDSWQCHLCFRHCGRTHSDEAFYWRISTHSVHCSPHRVHPYYVQSGVQVRPPQRRCHDE